MLRSKIRPLFWAFALIALATISMLSEWDGASFWIVFCALIAMGVADPKGCARRANGGC
ncbi:hypothetical protein WJS89_06980 [Sphingomicrobium sp. XHP0235]|uniref:hypothetical protein n=1 Tax=Sphingomicrobium aquimarinum TaxID=3133971 RepID=UPI0031FEF205